MSQERMKEERFEQALEAMRDETVSAEVMDAARARAWKKLAVPVAAVCGEFQPRLAEYLNGSLASGRRLLLEDHLSRCPDCRREMARLKEGSPDRPADRSAGRKLVGMPSVSSRRAGWMPWRMTQGWAVAAALVLAVLYVGRNSIDSMLAPGGPRLTVERISGELYRLPQAAGSTAAVNTALTAGATVGEGEVVRTGPGSRAMLRMADGSAIELNERSELYVNAAWTGDTIHLERGDVIVQAAKQLRGSLNVRTRDSLATVKGTVFAVSSGVAGSVVTVVEGSVAVSQPGRERVLRPGERSASNPAIGGSVRESISWSSDVDRYLALLAQFSQLEEKVAAIPAPALRTQSRLLNYMPANTTIYLALPNLGGTLREATGLAQQQAAQSPVFREWWESAAGLKVREVLERVQTVTPLLGDEIVFMLAGDAASPGEKIPMVIAEVQPGRREALAAAIAALPTGDRHDAPAYHLTDTLVVFSNSAAHLQWALGHLGQGSASPFAVEVAKRYQRGAGWLLAADPAGLRMPSHAEAGRAMMGFDRLRYVFIERRSSSAGEENDLTLQFDGARTGIASWLAAGGSGGAAEYISSEAVAAFSASTREPRQVFEEVIAQVSRLSPDCLTKLQEIETRLGISIAGDVAGAIGTDFAFAIERISIPIPGWVASVVVYRPAALDDTVQKLVNAYNSEPENASRRLTLEQESADGRVWNTLKVAQENGAMRALLTWTYDRGYLVAAADRALAARAITTRNGGFPLLWSAAFRQALPPATTLHPSGFAWLNTRGAMQSLSTLLPNASGLALPGDGQPALVVINGEQEQIRASSRTRIGSFALNMMTAGAVARAQTRTVAPSVRR